MRRRADDPARQTWRFLLPNFDAAKAKTISNLLYRMDAGKKSKKSAARTILMRRDGEERRKEDRGEAARFNAKHMRRFLKADARGMGTSPRLQLTKMENFLKRC